MAASFGSALSPIVSAAKPSGAASDCEHLEPVPTQTTFVCCVRVCVGLLMSRSCWHQASICAHKRSHAQYAHHMYVCLMPAYLIATVLTASAALVRAALAMVAALAAATPALKAWYAVYMYVRYERRPRIAWNIGVWVQSKGRG